MELFFRESGKGEPLIILHGFLGSSDNWFTLAKTFSAHYHVYLLDLRNHGQSPHSDTFNYEVMVDDMSHFFETQGISRAHLIGHSLGGKVVMNFAVKYPDKVNKLIVVDIVPRPYEVEHDNILKGLKSIKVEELQSRGDADRLLSEFVSDPGERQFLLKNLSRDSEGKFSWKMNLVVLAKNVRSVGEGMKFQGNFDGPALFIRGGKSNYYQPDDEKIIHAIFPNAETVTLDTGHWVQAENPVEFGKTAIAFLKG